MQSRGRSRRLFAFLLAMLGWSAGDQAWPQAPTCTCQENRLLGSCSISSIDYDGQDPGNAAVVPVGASTYLYVADASDGFVYRYVFSGGNLTYNNCPNSSISCFFSPFGSLPTPSGIAYHPELQRLFWAIGGVLYSSLPDLANPQFASSILEINPVDLAQLAALLDLPGPGELGGITYHDQRNTFWGVDIVNDIYFEFSVNGDPVVVGDRVFAFRSPARADPGKAFGNSIAYLEVAGQPYFDITVGEPIDRKASRVERVYASDGELNGLSFTIGDPVGVHYPLDAISGDDGVVSSVAFWPNTCGANQGTEVVLELGTSIDGESRQPRLHLVSGDAPQSPGLVRFACQANGNNVQLSWTTFAGFQSLDVVRTDTSTGEGRTVLSLLDGAAGDGQEIDRNVSDGIYEYSAILTAAGGQKFPERVCTAVVGRGSIVASADFTADGIADDRLPFAIAHVASRSVIVVADFNTGSAHAYDLDLKFKNAFPGPFHRVFSFQPGPTTGVAWVAETDELIWTQNSELGENFLQRTRLVQEADGDLAIQILSDPIRILTPLALHRPSLGDIDHDPTGKQLWAADRRNGVVYSFHLDGTLSGKSFTVQLPNPRTQGINFGTGGGGIAVVESTADTLVLDWTAGEPDAGSANFLDRQSYSRRLTSSGNGQVQDEVFPPGQTTLSLDLGKATESLQVGSMVQMVSGEDEFQYVTTWDTASVFKLRMSAGIAGKELVRGDANSDGLINISDPSFILVFLFKGGSAPTCMDAADVDDNEVINITDAVNVFRYLFLAGPPPPEPFSECGRDFDEVLSCAVTNCR